MQPFWVDLPPLANIVVGLAVGFGLSLLVGEWSVGRFRRRMESKLPQIDDPEPDKRVPREYTGRIERLAFTTFVIVQPGPALPAMMVWLGLKMAANWNKDVPTATGVDPRSAKIFRNRHAFLGLLTGFSSLSFAWAGGMLARWIMGLEA